MSMTEKQKNQVHFCAKITKLVIFK